MTIIQTLAHTLEPWNSAFANSTLLSGTVTGAHILSLLFSGGLAIGADRATLRATGGDSSGGTVLAERRRVQLGELGATHRPVLVAMTVLFLSGLLLAASDVETFLVSVVFWIKM